MRSRSTVLENDTFTTEVQRRKEEQIIRSTAYLGVSAVNFRFLPWQTYLPPAPIHGEKGIGDPGIEMTAALLGDDRPHPLLGPGLAIGTVGT